MLTNNSAYLATGQDNIPGSNRNAQALALAGGIAVTGLGGKSLQDYYTTYTGNLAAQAKNAADDVTAQGVLHDTLNSQVQAISGVSLDEETIHLMNFQQAYQGTARYINIINQMMQTVLTLVQ
jgi:flagellar hook-associated protein 1 FlgK